MVEISIIIPAMNEERSIGKVLDGVKNEMKGENYEIIVVDSSNDKTPLIAKQKGAIVVNPDMLGKGYAMIFGAKKSKGKILIFMDADGVNDPSYLKRMVKELGKADIVLVGPNPSKFDKNVKMHDKIIFIIYYTISTSLYLLAGMKFIVDPLTGYRALRKSTWDSLKLESKDFLIESEMNIKVRNRNLKITQILCNFVQREGGIGKSKLATNPFQVFKIAFFILKNAFKKDL